MVGACTPSHPRALKLIPATPQFEILDTIDDPGYITLQVSYISIHCHCALVGEILMMISKTIAHYALRDEEPDIHVEIVFIQFTENEAGALKLVSATEIIDLLAMVGVAVCRARRKMG